MTDDVRTRWQWLVVPGALTAALLLTSCGSVSRFAVDRDAAPPTHVTRDVPAAGDAAPSIPAAAEPTGPAVEAAIPTALAETDSTVADEFCEGSVAGPALTARAPEGDTAPAVEWRRDAEEQHADTLALRPGATDLRAEVPEPQSTGSDTVDEALARGDAGPVEASVDSSAGGDPAALALPQRSTVPEDEDFEPYDPWVGFNERVFEFNRQVDRVVLRPLATVYDRVVPDRLQLMIANGFDNLRSIPRLVNSLLQGKFDGALREFGRFFINTTIGIGGLFDMAQQEWGIQRSEEDFGQTLGVWGVGPGPYLVLPLMQPMTVRDGVGRGVDAFLDPLAYLLPFFWERLTMRVGEGVNDRSLNLELYEGFEETVIDMYAAVRHVYLLRRERMIRE